MVRCVMFDIGNVLVHFDTQRFYSFLKANQARYLDLTNPEEVFKLECLIEFDLGRIDTTEMFERVKKALVLNIDIGKFLFEFSDLMKPDPKMIALRQVLRGNGFKVGVVSNTNQYHFRYLRMMYPEVYSDFDYLALSFQLRVKKPDFKIWKISASNLGVKPEDCLLIDDLKTNIDAFTKWGGIGHHYNVVDEKFCPNGWLDIERRRLFFRMVSLGLLSYNQAFDVLKIGS